MGLVASKADVVRTVLIVDDEVSICRTLEGVLKDEGFETVSAHSAREALEMVKRVRPSLVLLDIWMPGMDGMEALREFKGSFPEIPVIMISGHATIETAMRAAKLGASDFIEKPLDLEIIVRAVKRAIAGDEAVHSLASGRAEVPEISRTNEPSVINPVVFASQNARGRRYPQRTLKSSAILYGQGLHTGAKSGLVLEPLPPNSGIHFSRVSAQASVPAHLDFVESTGFATTVRLGDSYAGTIEHLMSALHAYGVSNLLIKCNGEVPVMDGSALEFCSLIETVGLEEQQGDWFEIEVNTTIRVGTGNEFIQIEPADGFTIEYTLRYPPPVGEQKMTFTLDDPKSFFNEIAPARTFGFVKDIGWLQKQGLALVGRFDNFVLFGEDGAINTPLRFSDEPVRHKILDAVGDLYLLGRKLRGKVTASMTGHSDNIALLAALKKELLS